MNCSKFISERLKTGKYNLISVLNVFKQGLMVGVELVADKATKAPLDAERVLKIWEECKDLGVLFGKGGYYGNVYFNINIHYDAGF